MSALTDWARTLAAWVIPEPIAAQAVDSPWVLPRQVFARRAEAQIAAPTGATHAAARDVLAALPVPGTVLDVGVAAGATSLPLVGRVPVRDVTGVDADAELLAEFTARAESLPIPVRALRGRWPDVGDDAPVADVVACGNVVYNVSDLAPFVRALTEHARHIVVVEIAAVHPLTELNSLWCRFHGIDRPAGPNVEDCIAALAEFGVRPEVTRWRRPAEAEYATFAELVEVTRRRLCLPPTALAEVEKALLDLGVDPDLPPDLGSSGRELVTMSWPGSA